MNGRHGIKWSQPIYREVKISCLPLTLESRRTYRNNSIELQLVMLFGPGSAAQEEFHYPDIPAPNCHPEGRLALPTALFSNISFTT